MKHTILGFGCLLLMGLSSQVVAYDEDDLKELLKTKDCQQCDLTKANLWGANLNNANLTEANLTDAILQNAEDFHSADTTGAKFCRTTMRDGSTKNSGC